MSRGLIPIFTVLAVLALVWATAASGPETVQAIHAQLDDRLANGNRAFHLASQLSGQRALALAEESARSTGLVDAMSALSRQREAPDKSAFVAANTAVVALAERRGDAEPTALIGLANERGAAESRMGEADRFAVPRLPLTDGALGGSGKAAWASVDKQLLRLAAAPIGSGERPTGALILGYAVNDRFAERLEAETGAEITILAGDRVVASTLGAQERSQLGAMAGRRGEAAFSFGPAPKGFSFLGLSLPLGGSPVGSMRARAFPVPGIDGVQLVLSADAGVALAPAAAAQRRGLGLALAVLLVGVILTIVSRRSSGAGKLPELAEAAEALVAGDMSVRAPDELPGDLGRVADALNRLFARKSVEAEVASRAQAAGAVAAKILERQHAASQPAEPPPSNPGPKLEAIADGEAPVAAPPPHPWDSVLPSAPPPPPTPSPSPFEMLADGAKAGRSDGPSLWDRPTEAISPDEAMAAARASEFEYEQRAPAAKEAFNPEATMVAAVPEALLRATSRAPARPVLSSPVSENDHDEAHFEQVFRDFVATREQCGEPTDGIGFDKFAAKLRKNREQLIEKYRCRSVRFTVYVKEGRAALKATPVKD